nr:histidine kinase [Lysobacter psychrotolerans]
MFVARLVFAWFWLVVVLSMLWEGIGLDSWPVAVAGMLAIGFVITRAVSHMWRVRLLTNNASLNAEVLGNRHRRQIEIPLEAGEAFDLLEAAIRELPRVHDIESARDSLQIRAKVERLDPYGSKAPGPYNPLNWFPVPRNQILATVTPRDGTGGVMLVFEPESAAWTDWLRVDDGTNLENAEAITRAIARRVADRRRGEQTAVAQTVTEKELTVARLSLLHAQVEPHFLYNTLASAQYLTRSEPAKADEMLGHLIQYLRHSLPRTDESLSTLGDELDRSRAYLEILRIRMGPRLALQIDVPTELLSTPLPPMMLQTLVENAIKHGLEPKPGGGTVWILARSNETQLSVTVADDGLGLNSGIGGTGIGLKNVRERLRLLYGAEASLSIVANFPNGVASTICVPAQELQEHSQKHSQDQAVRRA